MIKSCAVAEIRLWAAALVALLLLVKVSFGQSVQVDAATADAVAAAQAAVTNEFPVSTERVFLIGQPLFLKDHVRMHRQANDAKKDVEPETTSSRAILVTLGGDIGEGLCGQVGVLVEAEKERVLTEDFSRAGESTLPFEAGECERVVAGVDAFMDTVLDYQRGPKRFLPFMARKTASDVLHEEFEEKLSYEGRRRMLSHFLSLLFFLQLRRFEKIEPPHTDEGEDERRLQEELDRARADERRYLALLDAHGMVGFDASAKFWREVGVLDREHLDAIRPCLKYLRSVIDKHQVDGDARALIGSGVAYHFDLDVLEFMFVLESGHFKLVSVYCRQ